MRKCPSCGRNYSDMVEQCPSCNVALIGNQEQVVVDTPRHAPDRPTVLTGGNSSADKIAMIIWGIHAVLAFVLVVFLKMPAAQMLGASGVGFLLGLIPKKVAESKGKQDLGKIALAATAIANGLFGLFASIPTLIIFIAIAFWA